MLVFHTSEGVSSQLDVRHLMRSFSPSLLLVHGPARSELQQGMHQALGTAGLALEKGLLCPDSHPMEQRGKWAHFLNQHSQVRKGMWEKDQSAGTKKKT